MSLAIVTLSGLRMSPSSEANSTEDARLRVPPIGQNIRDDSHAWPAET